MQQTAQIKITTIVSAAQHAALVGIAKQARTTIGAIARYAIGLALEQLREDPALADALERDARPEANRARRSA